MSAIVLRSPECGERGGDATHEGRARNYGAGCPECGDNRNDATTDDTLCADDEERIRGRGPRGLRGSWSEQHRQ
eukprot:4974142-Pyramimonas_sp.AAC.1